MTGPMAGAVGFLAVLLLIAARVPVAVAMGVVGTVGYGLVNGWSTLGFVLGRAPYESISPAGLSVLPLFIIMGVFSAHGGLSKSLYRRFASASRSKAMADSRWRPWARARFSAQCAVRRSPRRPPWAGSQCLKCAAPATTTGFPRLRWRREARSV